jgi:hypothetical protein
MSALLTVLQSTADSLGYVDMADTLNETWQAIRHQEPDVPQAHVSIVHGSGSPHWREDQRAVHVAETTVERGALEILHFLLHQAAHDLSPVAYPGSEGRYHSEDYKRAAERLKLRVTYVEGIGWGRTDLTAEVKTIYRPQITKLDAARGAWEVPARQATRRITVQCQCPRKLQVTRSVFAKGGITCDVCGQEFQPL